MAQPKSDIASRKRFYFSVIAMVSLTAGSGETSLDLTTLAPGLAVDNSATPQRLEA
jgi:hypothetical protein